MYRIKYDTSKERTTTYDGHEVDFTYLREATGNFFDVEAIRCVDHDDADDGGPCWCGDEHQVDQWVENHWEEIVESYECDVQFHAESQYP